MDANQVDHKDFDRLLKERDYYRKQVDELSGKIFSHDYKLSGLNHELMQLHKGFALIAELQTTIGAVTNFTVIFDKVVDAVAARMQMDRTVILQPLEHTNRFRPTHWLGYAHEQADEIARRQIEFPQESRVAASQQPDGRDALDGFAAGSTRHPLFRLHPGDRRRSDHRHVVRRACEGGQAALASLGAVRRGHVWGHRWTDGGAD